MFSAGLKLMVVGMLMVLLFLLLMIVFIKLIEILNRTHTTIEAKRLRQVPLKNEVAQETMVPPAVFAAAIASYEAERRQLIIT